MHHDKPSRIMEILQHSTKTIGSGKQTRFDVKIFVWFHTPIRTMEERSERSSSVCEIIWKFLRQIVLLPTTFQLDSKCVSLFGRHLQMHWGSSQTSKIKEKYLKGKYYGPKKISQKLFKELRNFYLKKTRLLNVAQRSIN